MERYLTTAEMAEARHMTTGSLEQERYRGEGPPYITNRKKVLYPLSLFEKWMRDQIITPGKSSRSSRRAAS